ncbi:ComEA family DNA-binding protein [Microbulbifer hydrolyticus]|uniref:Competence protein ComEA n=1 Tax=Microbulbifer hydrolyticus TaxID=48074 RepID=A0A6P1TF57_9GAMM|nr:helix-hairpin-helix domain-containing protein [Microbulbifer hydrolyticus]MBB5210077.1 competence protein ComEA [Microbulbifer hydrolyticus]QHQ39402.1 transporter [Microbulbifer hydrolyticus]
MKFFRIPLTVVFAVFLMLAHVQSVSAEEAVVQEQVQVNLNTASAEELSSALEGVGTAKAELIVKFREANGEFSSVEQLLEVKGIGMATLEKNRDRIQL